MIDDPKWIHVDMEWVILNKRAEGRHIGVLEDPVLRRADADGDNVF